MGQELDRLGVRHAPHSHKYFIYPCIELSSYHPVLKENSYWNEERDRRLCRCLAF